MVTGMVTGGSPKATDHAALLEPSNPIETMMVVSGHIWCTMQREYRCVIEHLGANPMNFPQTSLGVVRLEEWPGERMGERTGE